jgi:predicted RNase H-like HicB family nuclease
MRMTNLQAYERAALKHATLKFLGDGEGYAARIPGFKGLIVFGDTKREALVELRTALTDWIALSLRFGDGLPRLRDSKTALFAARHAATLRG